MEKFAIGLAIGAIVGATIVANSQKTRALVVKSQEELKTKIDDAIEQKLEELDNEDEEEDYSSEQPSKRFKKQR